MNNPRPYVCSGREYTEKVGNAVLIVRPSLLASHVVKEGSCGAFSSPSVQSFISSTSVDSATTASSVLQVGASNKVGIS